MERKTFAAGAALGGLYLLTRGGSAASTGGQSGNDDDGGNPFGFDAITEDGEIGLVDGIVYDDPETGSTDDEPGDDRNASFEEANDALETVGNEPVDPTQYAPDVQDGSTAPEDGVIADAGDSQNWGDAPEQENDDLTERAADSELSGDLKSAFDRYANQDPGW
ncbi:hypothetical protein [Halorarius litoreus]|uniref:hypothetical protein n=1 Tax=Halorarius litoreus TaxID=2962676 RepID=UPI0020CCDA87|nr:hypothetical protein [Halorarius litoreus]